MSDTKRNETMEELNARMMLPPPCTPAEAYLALTSFHDLAVEATRLRAECDAYYDGSHDAYCAGDCGRLTANGYCRDCMVHGGVNAYDRLELAKGFLRDVESRIAAAVAAERERVRELIRHELYGRFPCAQRDEFLVALDLGGQS